MNLQLSSSTAVSVITYTAGGSSSCKSFFHLALTGRQAQSHMVSKQWGHVKALSVLHNRVHGVRHVRTVAERAQRDAKNARAPLSLDSHSQKGQARARNCLAKMFSYSMCSNQLYSAHCRVTPRKKRKKSHLRSWMREYLPFFCIRNDKNEDESLFEWSLITLKTNSCSSRFDRAVLK